MRLMDTVGQGRLRGAAQILENTCGVWGVRCGVWGMGCRVWGVGCGVCVAGCGACVAGCGGWAVVFRFGASVSNYGAG